MSKFQQTWQYSSGRCCITSSKVIGLLVPEKILKGFYHIWAWRSSWLYGLDHLKKLSIHRPMGTLGNVVRGSQNYANGILTGTSGHELQTVDRLSTNLLSRYLHFFFFFFLREKICNWAMWFSIVFNSIQD